MRVVIFEILVVLNVKVSIFWDMSLSSVVGTYQLEGTCSYFTHHEGRRASVARELGTDIGKTWKRIGLVRANRVGGGHSWKERSSTWVKKSNWKKMSKNVLRKKMGKNAENARWKWIRISWYEHPVKKSAGLRTSSRSIKELTRATRRNNRKAVRRCVFYAAQICYEKENFKSLVSCGHEHGNWGSYGVESRY
jgi:hypothetical protein